LPSACLVVGHQGADRHPAPAHRPAGQADREFGELICYR